jgi:hypothetical protein
VIETVSDAELEQLRTLSEERRQWIEDHRWIDAGSPPFCAGCLRGQHETPDAGHETNCSVVRLIEKP